MTKQNRTASNKDLLLCCSEIRDRETGEGGKGRGRRRVERVEGDTEVRGGGVESSGSRNQ